jgi:hypothetical protein
VFFQAGTIPSSRRTASVGPGLAFYRDDDEPLEQSHSLITPRNGMTASRENTDVPPRSRPASVDSSTFQREFISHRENHMPLPTSSYAPTIRTADSSPQSLVFLNVPSATVSRPEGNAAQTLEESRNMLRAGIEAERRSVSFAYAFTQLITGIHFLIFSFPRSFPKRSRWSRSIPSEHFVDIQSLLLP